MTIWQPAIVEAGPVYLAITRALESDIASGRLQAGTKLPTQRDLARRLGVNVGTVSRAYAEARRRGLLRGEVGRGSYVTRPGRPALVPRDSTANDRAEIDLSINLPLAAPAPDLAAALRALADRPDLAARMGYQDPSGSERARSAGARWLGDLGVDVGPEQIVVCAGAQHAILVALASVVGPGDVLVTEALTYPGVIGTARLLGLRVQTVALDRDGIVPESLEAVCRSARPRLLYCMPALQNPTTARLSDDRRRALAEIATKHDLTIVQDDIQGGMLDDPGPSLAELAPEHVLTIASLSKNLVPALRVAFLAGRGLDAARAGEIVWSSVFMPSALGAEVASQWLEDGTARRIVAARRREMLSRHELLASALADARFETRPGAYHAWLHVDPPWTAATLTAELARRGVAVSEGAAFVAEAQPPPAAVRLSLSGPATHAELARGLTTIAELLAAGPVATPPRL